MNHLQSIKPMLKEWIVKGGLGAICTILVWTYTDVPALLLSFVQTLSLPILSKLLIGTGLLFLLAICVIILLGILLRNKLHPNFGLLWDNKGNPYCPSCEKLLTDYDVYAQPEDEYHNLFPGFKCIGCNKILFIKDANSPLPIDWREAKKRLNKK